ncbi:MAG: 2-amino-4-hydroxy-6-hydroxymethyldihydropteridine diphosphokinase [Pirellulales bacterium]
MPQCLISLGSNLGDRRAMLDGAVELLRGDARLARLNVSSWHETAPVGGPAGQPNFLNGAAVFQTELEPNELLAALHTIEHQYGRVREVHWGPRTLDLDLLLFGQECHNTPLLRVPHPHMAYRRFVLAPAAEVAPEMQHPVLRKSVLELLRGLDKPPMEPPR